MALLHAQHSLLVRDSSVSKTLQWWLRFLHRDTVGVLGLPFPLLLKLASPEATIVPCDPALMVLHMAE